MNIYICVRTLWNYITKMKLCVTARFQIIHIKLLHHLYSQSLHSSRKSPRCQEKNMETNKNRQKTNNVFKNDTYGQQNESVDIAVSCIKLIYIR
jgi:hypothetical protein